MEMVNIVAGLAWDPEFRGLMAVLTGVVVLHGSVWLLVSTNSGPRLGTLISLAAFFGWMSIMSTVWWIYGIGYAGDKPVWEEVEIVEGSDAEGHLTFAALDEANLLHTEELASAHDLVVDAAADLIDQYGANALTSLDLGDLSAEEAARVAEVQVAYQEYGDVSVGTLTPDQKADLSDDAIAALVAAENTANEATTHSQLAAIAPSLVDQDASELGGWTLLSTAQSGEAQASAIAMLVGSSEFDFDSQSDFAVLDAFTIGGKRGLPEDPTTWDRVSTKIRTAATITHPTRYGIIQIQRVSLESITNLPGQAPKRPAVDPNQPVVSIVMIRNLGNLRLVPALIAIGSLTIFLSLSYMLHERDKLVMARRAEFEAQ